MQGIFITGPPGIGKTTLIVKVTSRLKERGVKVIGFYTLEEKEEGVRVGFKLVNVSNGEWRWLAHVNKVQGPMVGKYHVDVNSIEWGLTLLNEVGDLYVIDEVGPMEMKYPLFLRRVEDIVNSKRFLITIHVKMRGWADSHSTQGKILRLSYVNRDTAVDEVLNYLGALLNKA
ncbi:nucleoside-triphosphatase [Caldivirga sp. UBA161]|uniref:nucleoside-triphosphatase n=1 Tax=Caldivirga sp. UBA161 TaxID=1915569 RepID=UPI0025C6E499|nr:nucleoside-triphosphatase [Caldivirga sp. UBA161]